jgi:4-diphosphocytidyl-2-C-methyl-D-erythritol kinase
VLGTRADGYHELRTIFQSIALHDTLTVRAARGPFTLTCDDPACPVDDTNLIARAAAAMWKAAGRRGGPSGVAIDLHKRIPIQAGLGGGSSDAAAALRALAARWRVADAGVRDAAVALGADVPYFLEGGSVLGLERGDLLFPLIDPPLAWVVLVLPDFGVSTRDAFAWFDCRDGNGDTRVRRGDPDVAVRDAPVNDLEAPVVARHPEIGRIISALARAGASQAAMSGSGSAVFGLFSSRSASIQAQKRLAGLDYRTLATRTLSRRGYQRLAAT